jgi:sucrose-6-phosphate hydrolase SacC (GH32 family)
MTVPRELLLRQTPEGYRLLQRPTRELDRLRDGGGSLRSIPVVAADAWLATQAIPSGLAEFRLQVSKVPSSGALALVLRHGTAGETRIEADFRAGTLSVDRRRSGRSDFSPAFAGLHSAPLRVVDGRLDLVLLLDTSSVEVFAQGGESVLTDLALPESEGLRLSLVATGEVGKLRVDSLSLWPLRPAPPVLNSSKP